MTIVQVAEEAKRLAVDVVIVDTLSRVAQIADENDNAKWTAWWDKTLPLVRATNAVWVFVHHDRKSGGQRGEAIRGASAIFANVDIAFSLHRVDGHKSRRTLRMEGTRYDDADDLTIELRDNEYKAIGDARVVEAKEDPQLSPVLDILTDEPAEVAEILAKLNEGKDEADQAKDTALRHRLDKLAKLGLSERSGRGGQKDPYKYRLLSDSDTQDPKGSEELRNPGNGLGGDTSQTAPEVQEALGPSSDAKVRPWKT